MTNFFQHMRNAKLAAKRQSFIDKRQMKAKRLDEQIQDYYDKVDKGEISLNARQITEIKRLREEFGEKQMEIQARSREVAEEFMQKEIDVILDLGNKYQIICSDCHKPILGNNWYAKDNLKFCSECWSKK